MTKLFHFINVPLAWVLRFIADAFNGNFAAAVFIFTLLINIVFIPLTIKSQKSAVQQLRTKPKLDELKKKYGDDKQKYSQAMSQLYQEENVSMSGGCLPMLFRMLVLMSIYSLIMSPLTYLMNVDAGVISEAANALKEAGIEIAKNTRGQGEIQIINAVLNGTISSPEILEAAKNINFNLFGLNLTETPKFSFNIFGDFQAIWLMPIFSFASQMLVSFISTILNPYICLFFMVVFSKNL
jgi:YidC/Oxa1 family membrane protein insertase